MDLTESELLILQYSVLIYKNKLTDALKTTETIYKDSVSNLYNKTNTILYKIEEELLKKVEI